MYPNWDFWLESKPSGNPGWHTASPSCACSLPGLVRLKDGKVWRILAGESGQTCKAANGALSGLGFTRKSVFALNGSIIFRERCRATEKQAPRHLDNGHLDKGRFADPRIRSEQGCQIFLGAIYQNEGKIYPMTTNSTNGFKIFPRAIKYTNIFHSKVHKNKPKLELFAFIPNSLCTYNTCSSDKIFCSSVSI
jgi:hypothetical protein